MSFWWREAGVSYVFIYLFYYIYYAWDVGLLEKDMTHDMTVLRYLKYSNIAAKALRASLKGDAKVQALKREETILKVAVWAEGKQGEGVILIYPSYLSDTIC